MDPTKISERTRRQLEKLPPEKRAKAEEAVARTQTPEFRARVDADRAALDREYRKTGTIRTVGERIAEDDLRKFVTDLRVEREGQGFSLADVAGRTGIDKSALSKLENGQQLNPTVGTLARYARAIGKRLVLKVEDLPPDIELKVGSDGSGNPEITVSADGSRSLIDYLRSQGVVCDRKPMGTPIDFRVGPEVDTVRFDLITICRGADSQQVRELARQWLAESRKSRR